MLVYEGRSFNSGTNAPPYHMAIRQSWKLQYFHGGVYVNNGTKFCLIPLSLSKVIESSNGCSRNTLAKLACVQ